MLPTGTITSGTLTLTEARVLTFNDTNSSSAGSNGPLNVQVLPLRHTPSTSSVSSIDFSSDEGAAFDDQQGGSLNGANPHGEQAQRFGEDALRYAVALSRASNHPVSRAMLAYALSEQAQVPSPSHSPGASGRAALATIEEEVKVSRVNQVGRATGGRGSYTDASATRRKGMASTLHTLSVFLLGTMQLVVVLGTSHAEVCLRAYPLAASSLPGARCRRGGCVPAGV
jgi:hypothetical protein